MDRSPQIATPRRPVRSTAPARHGFAAAVREIRALLAGRARAVELYGASGALGAAIAAATSRRDVALHRPRRGDRRDAGRATSRSSCPRRRAPATIRWRRRRCSSCRRPSRRPTPRCSPTGARRCGGWRRCSGCRRGSRRACWWRRRRRCSGGSCRARRSTSLCEVIASGTTLDRDATIAALRARRLLARAGRRGRGDVRGARRGDRSLPAGLPPPGAHRAVRRRGRVDPPLRRGDAADAAPARRGLPAPGARDHPDARAPIRARASWPPPTPPSTRRRRRGACSSRSRRASSSSASRRWRPAFHARMVPLFDYLPADALLRRRGSGGGARRGAPAGDAAARGGGRRATSSTGWRCPRRTSCWARTRRRRRWRRGGGWSCAPSRSCASTRRPTRRRASASSQRRTRRCARSCTRRARAAAGARTRARSTSARRCAIACARWLDAGYRVRVVAPNRTHAERLVALLRALRARRPTCARARAAPSSSTGDGAAGRRSRC